MKSFLLLSASLQELGTVLELKLMVTSKSPSLFSTLLVPVIFVLAGCSLSKEDDSQNGLLRVKIPLFEGSSQKYQLKSVDILTLQNRKTLSGEAVDLLMFPRVINNNLQGLNPRASLKRTSSGEYIASDHMTLKLVTLYYHFEQLMFLDEKIGVKKLNQWPLKVAVDAQGTLESGELEVNQAKYLSRFDSYAFYPYRDNSAPLTVNAGVIAHEHFHSLFDKIVMVKVDGLLQENLTEKRDRRKIQALVWTLRGINEGLADVWGWNYSGQVNFIAESLPSVGLQRKLTANLEPFRDSAAIIQNFSTCFPEELCLYQAYELGAQYAKFFVQFLKDSEMNQESIAKTLVSVAQEISDSVVSSQSFETDLPLKALLKNYQTTLTEKQCSLILGATQLSVEGCNQQ